jgi:hypothetical protein
MIRITSTPPASSQTVCATSSSREPSTRPTVCQRYSPALDAILLCGGEWVRKSTDDNLEAHAVLPEIAFGLRRIPFESYFHDKMLLQFCINIKAIQLGHSERT